MSDIDVLRTRLADLLSLRDEPHIQAKPHILSYIETLIAEAEAELACQPDLPGPKAS